jgi:GDP-L-fucose synthase
MILAAQKLSAYAAINIGLGQGHSVKEILGWLLEIDGYGDAQVRYDPSKPTMIPIRLIDTRKAQSLLGFRAKVDLREGLKRTVDWYRRSRNLPRPR